MPCSTTETSDQRPLAGWDATAVDISTGQRRSIVATSAKQQRMTHVTWRCNIALKNVEKLNWIAPYPWIEAKTDDGAR
jgi:hypothetical protein